MIVWTPPPGLSLIEACTKAVDIAKAADEPVSLFFNGTSVVAHPCQAKQLAEAWTSMRSDVK